MDFNTSRYTKNGRPAFNAPFPWPYVGVSLRLSSLAPGRPVQRRPGPLTRAGVAVKLIDRSTFPRNKPCGGAVNLRVLHRFPCFEQELERTATHAVSRLALEGPGGDSTIEESDGPAALMIRRVEFDALLVSLAVEAGAELVTGMDIVQASATDGRVSLTGRDGRQVEASVVIAAGACVLPRVRREGAVRATARVGRAVARAGRDGRRIRQAQLHAVPDFRRRAAAQSRPRPGGGGRRCGRIRECPHGRRYLLRDGVRGSGRGPSSRQAGRPPATGSRDDTRARGMTKLAASYEIPSSCSGPCFPADSESDV